MASAGVESASKTSKREEKEDVLKKAARLSEKEKAKVRRVHPKSQQEEKI